MYKSGKNFIQKDSYKISRSFSYVQIIDPHNYLLMILDGKILRGSFKHEKLKPAVIRISQGNVYNLTQLKWYN